MVHNRYPYKIKNFIAKNPAEEPICAIIDCEEIGKYRAPKSQKKLHNYYYFCLKHIREYNASWNYCKGMSTEAIEREIRRDSVWRRPTWPLNGQPLRVSASYCDSINDLRWGSEPADSITNTINPSNTLTPDEKKALSVLGLIAPVTMVDVKQRYKLLVKKLHPDVNGGDAKAEERLKSINNAYKMLRDSGRLG